MRFLSLIQILFQFHNSKWYSCHGGNDGQIIVNVTGGGTPPYEFDWVNHGNVNSPFLLTWNQALTILKLLII